MFHVPGWNISARSLIREQPEAKPRKKTADPDQAKKRKRAQPPTHWSRKIDGNELEKLWDQRFGSNGEQATLEDGTIKQHSKKTDFDSARSKSNRLPLQHTNAGGEHATAPEQRISSETNRDGNISRKQKKLRNLLKRNGQDSHNAPVLPDESTTPFTRIKHEPVLRTPVGENGPSRILDQAPHESKQKKESVQHAPDDNPTATHDELRANNPSAQLQHNPETSTHPQTSLSPAITTTTLHHPRNHVATSRPTTSSTTHPLTTTLTPLQSKMALKLTSARFRHLNQQLYTTPSSHSLTLFTTNPTLFTEYHTGFTHSTLSWPTNPITLLTNTILTRPTLPRRKTNSCTIADLGCGDAPLARTLITSGSAKKLSLTIHSYDLYAANKHVTVADISSLPLRDGEADIAIFCLSLMGTNWLEFVEECRRILRGDGKGEVWVAEVKSRFGRVVRRPKGVAVENSVGNRKRKQQPKGKKNDGGEGEEVLDEELFAEDGNKSQDGGGADATDISAFVQVFQRRGFQLKEDSVDKSNKMFVSMVFHKTGVPTAGKHKGLKWNGKEYQKQHDGKMKFTTDDDDTDRVDPGDEAKVLKPCVYKTR